MGVEQAVRLGAGASGALEHAPEFGDEAADIASGVGSGGLLARGVRGGGAAGAAEAVGECFGWAGCAAFGAFHHQVASGAVGRGRCRDGGQVGWDLVGEAAAYEADGGADLGGEAALMDGAAARKSRYGHTSPDTVIGLAVALAGGQRGERSSSMV